MYYLLEDNRIIKLYNAKFSECGLLKVYGETGKVTTLKLDGTIERYTGYFVKKQSENVYDLIDWDNDLVRVDNIIYQCKYFHRDLREEYIERKWFNSIYKPDANGNYIKVWEEKGE